MKAIYIIIIVVAVILLTVAVFANWSTIQQPVHRTPLQTDEEQIREALAAVHEVDISQITGVHIEENNGQFAWGQATVGQGLSSGTVFYAAEQYGQWIIVDTSGGGIPNCVGFDTYNFPRDMYTSCIETNGELREVNRVN